MEVRFPLHQIRRCAANPRRARWPGHNVYQVLASVASRLAPGWPMVTRIRNMDDVA